MTLHGPTPRRSLKMEHCGAVSALVPAESLSSLISARFITEFDESAVYSLEFLKSHKSES
jgi:hypothetical protein